MWFTIAAAGLGVLSDSINNGIKSIGTESMARFEETYDIEVLQDATVKPSPCVRATVVTRGRTDTSTPD
ncbi:hypothetical protein WJX82_011133 [Trebouxia sp. C0006]